MLVLAYAYDVNVIGKRGMETDGAIDWGLYAILLLLVVWRLSLTWPFNCVTCCTVNTIYGLTMHSIINLNIQAFPANPCQASILLCLLARWMQSVRSLSSVIPIVLISLWE